MKHYFPPIDKSFRYLQTNRSDVLGSLWSTFNIDLQSNLGKMRLSKKLVMNTSSADDADLGVPSAFEYWNNQWWAICDTTVFSSASHNINSAFTEDAGTNAVKTYSFYYSDLAVFDNRLWATDNDQLRSLTGTTWTVKDTLSSNVLHKLVYFKKFDRLYYSNATDTISSIDSSDVTKDPGSDYAIDLGASIGQISTMVATKNQIFIGTIKSRNTTADNGIFGSIIIWDGVSSQITDENIIKTAGILSMVVVDDIPYAIDTEGRILQFSGYAFKEIARLPIDNILLQGSTVTSGGLTTGRPVHFNGMTVTKNDTILINIRNRTDKPNFTSSENLASGIWELDLSNNNLTHRYSFTLKTQSSSTVTDFGQNVISIPGAIKTNTLAQSSSNGTPIGRSTLLAGAAIFTDASTEKYAIFVDSPTEPSTDTEGQKRGYFITTWFEANELVELWQKISETHRLFLNSTDKIIFKYRTTKETPIYADITWVNTTSFTTTTDISAFANDATGFDGTYGGEVEILQGTGSGACVHITGITEAGGTYTVTVDNAVTGVTTGTAKARFQKWKKITPEITGQVDEYSQRNIDKATARIQIKGILEFTGDDEFHKFILSSQNHIKLEG